MRSRLLPCLLLTLGSTAAGTAQEYSVATLADSLRRNAQAVVRLYETDFQYNSPSSATARHDIVVTLLDRRGARHADLVCYVDMFSSLKSFSAEICDASGRVIRKLGKGDLNYTEYSQHLADDAAYYWLEPPLSVFPCTVRYRYETAHKNGMFGTLRFVPLSTDIGVALEKARFRLSAPAGYAFNCRCTPFPVEPVRHTDRGRDQLRMDIPVPHGRARRTADSARPRTAADPLLRAVGVHLRQNAGEYAGLAPFRRLDGRTARGPRTAASGLAGRNTRPDRHDPRQTGKNRGALPLSGTHDPLREHPVGHRGLAADGRRNGLCE